MLAGLGFWEQYPLFQGLLLSLMSELDGCLEDY